MRILKAEKCEKDHRRLHMNAVQWLGRMNLIGIKEGGEGDSRRNGDLGARAEGLDRQDYAFSL